MTLSLSLKLLLLNHLFRSPPPRIVTFGHHQLSPSINEPKSYPSPLDINISKNRHLHQKRMSSSGVNLEKYLIPLAEINRATEKFSRGRYIGGGGFGAVYRGQLCERWENCIVAVKRLDSNSYQGECEFRNEIELISKFNHENIIAFVGYCDEGGEMIIVYEYASNGSLDDHLRDPNKMSRITWSERLEICIGAAKGLQCLHSGLGKQDIVIHRDVKSANILLDDNMVAKICDFGLSKLGSTNQPNTQLNTKVAGTQFYMDPTYHESGILRKESDVYSFGVVLFEILSGMPVYGERYIGDERQSLMNTVRRYNQNEPDKVADPSMRDRTESRSLNTFKEIAYKCIDFNFKIRPTLDTIIYKLEEALAINMYKQFADGSMIGSIIGKLNSVNPSEQRIALNKILLLTEYCKKKLVAFAHAEALIPVLAQLLTAPDSWTQEHALTALLNLFVYECILTSSEAVLGIVHILEKGNNEAREKALTLLLNLSKKKDNRGSIISSGAVPQIVDILEHGSNIAREKAAVIISRLSEIHEAPVTISSAGAIPPLVLLLSEGTSTGKKNAADALSQLRLFNDYNGRAALSVGVVPILMELLMEPHGVLKEESVDLLSQLSFLPEGKLAIAEAEAVPHLVEVIGSEVSKYRETDAVSLLVKLCDMDEKYLVEAEKHGVMGKLKDLRHDDYDWVKRDARRLRRKIKDHQHVDHGSDREDVDAEQSGTVNIPDGGPGKRSSCIMVIYIAVSVTVCMFAWMVL